MTIPERGQRVRVERILRAAGQRGICQGEFLAGAPDGGGSITRLAARIEELRERGVRIDASTRADGRDGFVVYRLRERVGVAAGFAPAALCHGCLSTLPAGVTCPRGHRLEAVLVDPHLPGQTQACRRVHATSQEERRAA